MKQKYFPVKMSGLAEEWVEKEVIVYDKNSGLVHHLNRTASMIWQCCDGEHSCNDIVRTIGEQFEATEENITEDVMTTLTTLEKEGLLAKERENELE